MSSLFKKELSANRNFGLDVLRFVAIITVLISHSSILLPEKFSFINFLNIDGVLIFFVLSGFLIGRIFIRDFEDGFQINKLFNFWKRRWFRTLPAYYFTIFLIIILSYILHRHFDYRVVFKHLFFIQNLNFHSGEFFPESWSLAIEEWFYLTFPLISFFIFKAFKIKLKYNILICSILIIIFCNALRFHTWTNTDVKNIIAWDQYFRSPVLNRLDSLMFGVIGAWFFVYKSAWFEKVKNVFFIIGIIIFVTIKISIDFQFLKVNSLFTSVFYLSIMPLSVLLIIPKAYFLRKTKLGLLYKLITVTSLVSYSMYLLNLTVITYLILQPLHIHFFLKFILFWLLTLTGSIFMYFFIEKPFMQLREGNKKNLDDRVRVWNTRSR